MKTTFRLGPALLLIVLLAAACVPTPQVNSRSPLEINSMVSSLGGEGANNDTGVYSYTIILINRSDRPINVQSVTPEMQRAFSSRLLSPILEQPVGHAIPSGESIEINGEIRFDFTGLSKQQIVDLGEPISGFSVASQIYVLVPSAR